MHKIITISTDRSNALYDITAEVTRVVKESDTRNGLVNLTGRGREER